jgi:hypothetical protein
MKQLLALSFSLPKMLGKLPEIKKEYLGFMSMSFTALSWN